MACLGLPLSEAGEKKIIQHAIAWLDGRVDRHTVIGISMVADTSLLYSLPLAQAIRRKFPCIIIGGGYAASFAYPILLEAFAELFDAVVVGPGEVAVLGILDRVAAGNPNLAGIPGVACSPGRRAVLELPAVTVPIQELPTLDFSVLENREVFLTAAYDASRGCPRQCEFCPEAVLVPRFQVKSADQVGADLAEIRRWLPNCEGVALTDPTFGIPGARFEGICGQLAQEGLPYGFETRCDEFPERLYPALSGHCQVISFGLEAARSELLRRMNKTQDPAEYLGGMRRNAQLCFENDILPVVSFMPNYPLATEADLEADLTFARDLRSAYANQLGARRGLVFDGGFPYIVSYGRRHYLQMPELRSQGVTFAAAFPPRYQSFNVPPLRYNVVDASISLPFARASYGFTALQRLGVTEEGRTNEALRRCLRSVNLSLLRGSADDPADLYLDTDRDVINFGYVATNLCRLNTRYPQYRFRDALAYF
ncbi:MAG: radical SAM protein [Planctomycetota bacterium]|nr:radical SAM protein [Planctomycetota bacterium]